MGKKASPGRVGIAAVAAAAGVSPATVSRVMNGNYTVDAQIAARVRQVATELNYQPNPLGRSLVLGKTETIGVIVPDLANPTFQAALHGVSRAAAKDGYRVLIADSAETTREEPILSSEMRRRCDGVILCAPRMSIEQLSGIAESLRPLVLINRPDDIPETPSFSVDYGHGITELAEHVLSLGHRRIAYLAGPARSVSHGVRLASLEKFAAAHPEVELRFLEAGSSFESGHSAVDKVLDAGVTAVLAFNDLVAMGLLSGLHERGVKVPEDISVTGFDDIPFASYTMPPLTSAEVSIDVVGERAWQSMRSLLRKEPGEGPLKHTFEPTLRPRGSTGPAPRG